MHKPISGLSVIFVFAYAHIGVIDYVAGGMLRPNLYASCAPTSALHFPFLLAMSASNTPVNAALNFKDLTQDEQILHHYAAMVKADLQAYIASPSPSRDEQAWGDKFKKGFVFLKYSIHRHKLG